MTCANPPGKMTMLPGAIQTVIVAIMGRMSNPAIRVGVYVRRGWMPRTVDLSASGQRRMRYGPAWRNVTAAHLMLWRCLEVPTSGG